MSVLHFVTLFGSQWKEYLIKLTLGSLTPRSGYIVLWVISLTHIEAPLTIVFTLGPSRLFICLLCICVVIRAPLFVPLTDRRLQIDYCTASGFVHRGSSGPLGSANCDRYLEWRRSRRAAIVQSPKLGFREQHTLPGGVQLACQSRKKDH